VKTLQPRRCPACGAPVPESAQRCEHCGAWFEPSLKKEGTRSPGVSILRAIFPKLPADAGEFGFRGRWSLALGMGLAFVLYILGWLLEDTQYWLAPGSIAVWGAVLPIWLALTAFVWRTPRPAWLVGLAAAAALFATHLAIVWLLRSRINDDLIGIASIYAGLAFAGWLLGRWLRALLRRQRVRGEKV
jgi:predicted nucleic acid-binding Zn ribbon protein